MKDVIDLVDSIRVKSAKFQDDLANTYRMSPQDPPIGALGISHNNAVMTLELLDFYHRIWGTVPASAVPDPERTKKENAERVMVATKSMFIMCLSGFEFSAKQAILARPGGIHLPSGRTYLRAIMDASAKQSLISPETQKLWAGAIAIRNCLVHNNGIADKNAEYGFPGLTVKLVVGQMAQGTLKFFPILTDWTVKAFADWCRTFLQ